MLGRLDRENNRIFKDKELNSTVADRDALQGWVFIWTAFFNFMKVTIKKYLNERGHEGHGQGLQ